MPKHYDPDINYQRIGALSKEFWVKWQEIQAFYLDAASGFQRVRAAVGDHQATMKRVLGRSEFANDEFLDTCSFSYREIFSEEFCTSSIHTAKQGEVRLRNAAEGRNFQLLGQLCLTSFYDYWNEYFRREYVIAKGKLDHAERDNEVIQAALRKHGSFDLWGDLRHLRISIVHHKGIATPEAKDCKLIKWFKPGDLIALTPNHMNALFMALVVFRNSVDAEQYAPMHIKIPDFRKPEHRDA